MRTVLLASVIIAAAAASSTANADATLSGTFLCRVLFQDALTGADGDQFMPSVLGTTTLDGRGGYVRREGGAGSVTAEGAVIKFTSGEMMGIVAVLKKDPRGRAYLHIDGEVDVRPAGDPKAADFVCYQQ